MMDMEKVSTRGRITVPLEIHHILNLKPSGKILFVRRHGGEIALNKVSATLIRKTQTTFHKASKALSLHSEGDV